jgi:hypothetical protein
MQYEYLYNLLNHVPILNYLQILHADFPENLT